MQFSCIFGKKLNCHGKTEKRIRILKMGRYDNLHGDEDEIEAEFQRIKEEVYQAQGDEESDDWYS